MTGTFQIHRSPDKSSFYVCVNGGGDFVLCGVFQINVSDQVFVAEALLEAFVTTSVPVYLGKA